MQIALGLDLTLPKPDYHDPRYGVDLGVMLFV
jgi:hypothetical protein